MLVREKRASSANGAFGRHERHEVLGMRLLTPLPTAFPLSGAGAGMMGLLGRRRRRTNPSIGGCVITSPFLWEARYELYIHQHRLCRSRGSVGDDLPGDSDCATSSSGLLFRTFGGLKGNPLTEIRALGRIDIGGQFVSAGTNAFNAFYFDACQHPYRGMCWTFRRMHHWRCAPRLCAGHGRSRGVGAATRDRKDVRRNGRCEMSCIRI